MRNDFDLFTDDGCSAVNGIFMTIGTVSVFMTIILNLLRKHTAIAVRHPIFSIIVCSLTVFYCFIVLPLSCMIDFTFNTFYLLRAFSIFAWFWACLCRYQLLYLDTGFLTAIKLVDTSIATFDVIKSDYSNGNTYVAYAIFGAYFIICFIALLIVCVLHYGMITMEIVFTLMCIIPLCVIMFWVPHSFWDVRDYWKVRDELVYVFMITSILMFCNCVITLGSIWLDIYIVLSIKTLIEATILSITMGMCSIWVIMKVPRDRMMKAPSLEELAKMRNQDTIVSSDELPLGYVLTREYGYKAFLQHCIDEVIHFENLQFLAQICHFKKEFLKRIEKLHMKQLSNNLNNQNDESLLGHMDDDDDDNELQLGIVGVNNNDRMSDEHRRGIKCDKLIWSVSNSLTILILKMQHGLESMSEIIKEKNDNNNDNNNNNNNSKKKGRKINKMAQLHEKYSKKNKRSKRVPIESIEDRLFKNTTDRPFEFCLKFNHDDDDDDDDNDDIPLYIIAYGLYLKFIIEGGDSQVNISPKTRSYLHHFFDTWSVDLRGSDYDRCGPGLGYRTADDPPRGPEDEIDDRNKTSGQFKSNNNNNNNNDDTSKGYTHEMLKDRENPNSKHSYVHLYRLYHIFDAAWAEIFHLIVNNVYPRFTSRDKFENIKEQLSKDLKDETPFLKHLINGEYNDCFETLKPRSLIIIGVDKIPFDEEISYFGKTLQRV